MRPFLDLRVVNMPIFLSMNDLLQIFVILVLTDCFRRMV